MQTHGGLRHEQNQGPRPPTLAAEIPASRPGSPFRKNAASARLLEAHLAEGTAVSTRIPYERKTPLNSSNALNLCNI